MRRATNTAAVTDFVTQRILPGHDWELESVSRRSMRLEPPHDYWASYRVRLQRPMAEVGADGSEAEGERPELRLVTRGVFDPDGWRSYRDQVLAPHLTKAFDPLAGCLAVVADDDAQVAIWVFPLDPRMPSLIVASDGAEMRTILRRRRELVGGPGSHLGAVEVAVQRYVPERSALLRYRVEVDGVVQELFGRVEPGDSSAEMHHLMDVLWEVAHASPGGLNVPRPRGYIAELNLGLSDVAPGEPVGSDRRHPEFREATVAAAEALADLHQAPLTSAHEMGIDAEIARLASVVEQLAYVHPRASRLLRELVDHLRKRAAREDEDVWLPTHGDLKYDQLLRDPAGNFTLIDWEYFGLAETSWDLAKFCAHAVPSMPEDWEESLGAEQARAAFLERYLELRPDATVGRFPLHEATHLASRAMVMMWGQRPGWEDAAESILALAMERLKLPAP